MRGELSILLTCALLLTQVGSGVCAQEAKPDTGLKGTLKWANGDRMSGEWQGVEKGWLNWKAQDLGEAVRVWLPRTVGYEVDGVFLPIPIKGPWTMTAADGSFFGCETWAMDGAVMKTKTEVAGEVAMRWEAVTELRRAGEAEGLIYAGPAGEAKWVKDNPGDSGGQPWTAAEGGALRTRSIDQSIALPVKLPEKMRMDFWLKSVGTMPQFRWKIRHAGLQLEVETWMEELVGRGADSPLRMTTLYENEVMLTVCVDFSSKQAVAYGRDAKELGRWKLRGEKTRRSPAGKSGGLLGALAGAVANGFKANVSSSGRQSQAEISEGLMLTNLGADLSLERLLVRSWDGAPLVARPQDAPFVETISGLVYPGKITRVQDGMVQVGEAKLPLEEVAWMRGAPLRQAGKPAKPETAPLVESAAAWYVDGSVLHGRLADGAKGELKLRTALEDKPWVLNRFGLMQLTWLVPEPFAGPPTASVAHLDVWEQNKKVMRGTWEPGEGEAPRWKLDGADKAAAVTAKEGWHLRRALAGVRQAKVLPGLAHLESGELVPAELEAWDREELLLRSMVSADGSAAKLPVEKVLALELPGEGLKARGFHDAGWVALRGGEKGVALDKPKGRLTLQPGAAFGHGSFLQGTQVSFKVSGSQSYGTLRVRLFCEGLNEKSPHLSLLIMRSGSTAYCGIEDPRRPGQVRGNMNRIPIEYDKPFNLRLGWTASKVEAWVNGSPAVTHAVTEATRSGDGWILEPASVWGNDVRDMILTDMELAAAPGARVRPMLEGETRAWALQVPRRLAADAPRHLLLARSGDVLRGSVESVSSRMVTLRSGLETLEVPRERVALMVLPKAAGAKPAEEKPAGEKESLSWLELADGGKLRLKVTAMGPQWVEGESALLGRCRIPADTVVAISSGEPLRQQNSLFSGWQFTQAPEPEIPTAAEGKSAELKGQSAPNFDLELVAGGRFKLEEAKGKVVVLDFWATWCGPCLKAMPEVMTALKELPQDQVRLVGVNQAQGKAEVTAFLKAREWDLEVALDLDQKVGQLFGVSGIPHTVVVGPDGKVAWVSTGYSATMAKELTEVVRKLLP